MGTKKTKTGGGAKGAGAGTGTVQDNALAKKIDGILAKMSLEDKCKLLNGGEEFATRIFEQYGIPVMELSDGPNGLRKQEAGANHLGLGGSIRATCFPTAATVANSWDPELGERIGAALAEESGAAHVAVLLGPGLNMKRSPLCGRNFEYFSEDPYLAGKMAAGYIRGTQKSGLSACPKHFAVNNQETYRMSCDSVVDERTLREIYLTGFEIAVKEGQPKSIMTSYNPVNGTYANENPHLLQDILRGEWGYNGMIVTDWGGSNDHVEGVRCTSDLEMPVPGPDSAMSLVRAVKNGTLPEEAVNSRVRSLLNLILPTAETLSAMPKTFDEEAHHQVARAAASRSIVLLKNDKPEGATQALLPLSKGTRAALIGDFAKTPRYQGAGSSMVNPTRLDNLYDSLTQGGELEITGWAAGYKRHGGEDAALLKEAVETAQGADVVIFCLGLDEIKESEGLDRADMKINDNQVRVLEAVAALGKPVVAVLSGGSPVEMPWIDACTAIVHGYLGGQAGAGAMADVLTGRITPGGKLSETWAMTYEETPAYRHFPGEKTVQYREGLYIGYRYYNTVEAPVRFPFGYGLSYTEFVYENLKIGGDGVTFTIRNAGGREGDEIAQLYVHLESPEGAAPCAWHPAEELKGFARVHLEAGEAKEVTIPFDDKTFRYFNTVTNGWETEGGTWEIRVGASSRDIRLSGTLGVSGTTDRSVYDSTKFPSYISGKITDVPDTEFAALLGREIPSDKIVIDRNIAFGQLNHGRSPIFRIVWAVMTAMLRSSEKKGTPNLNMMFIYNMPLRALQKMTGGLFTMGMVDGLVWEVKGLWIIGFLKFIFEFIKGRIAP